MNQRVLKPLEYMELCREVFNLYKNNLLFFFKFAGAIFIPLFGSITVFFFTIFKDIDTNKEPDWRLFAGFGLICFLVGLLSIVFHAAIVWATSRLYFGYKPTIIESYKAVLPRIGAFFLTLLLVGVAVMVGMLFCYFPGLIIAFLMVFVPMVFVLENKGYITAMKRSWELAKAEWVRILVVWLILFVVMQGVMQAVMMVFMPAFIIPFIGSIFLSSLLHGGPPAEPNPALIFSFYPVIYLVMGIVQSFLYPLQMIALTILYYDIRVRHEGFGEVAGQTDATGRLEDGEANG